MFTALTKEHDTPERPPIPRDFGISRAPTPTKTITVEDKPLQELSPTITNAQQDVRLKEEIRKLTE